jgi:ADP-ribose pyrophosphatase YjhB (NUDIX family)
MTTDRRFARFDPEEPTASGRKKDDDTAPFAAHEIPDGGMCLSTFVVLIESGHRDRVLLGHLDPEARWDHIGALDPARVKAHSKGWMIPSSHLLLKESPHEAAGRILKEQLELDEVALSPPIVVSEAYTPRRFPDLPSHWDLEFIFKGKLPKGELPKASAWKELSFVDLGRTGRSEMARSHEDVLESAGFKFAKDSAPIRRKGAATSHRSLM